MHHSFTAKMIERREESLGTLKRFRDHLVAGGRLILDLELQTDFSVGTVSTGSCETSQGETITMEAKVVEVNFLEQYSVSHLRYEKWRDGDLLQTEMQRFPLRWYGLEEFELVLERLGFTEVVVSADYEYGKRPSSADQTFTPQCAAHSPQKRLDVEHFTPREVVELMVNLL